MTATPYAIRRILAADDAAMARVIRSVMTEFGCCGAGFSIHDAEVDGMTAAYAGAGSAYWVVVPGAAAGDAAAGPALGGAGFGPLVGSDPADRVCELRKMYIEPSVRGTGAGRALLQRCLDGARAAGHRTMYLETFRTMDAAQRLYRAAGFAPIDGPLGRTGHSGCDRFFSLTL